MSSTDLECTHRQIIANMNAKAGWDWVYYRDIEIDAGILPLVALLNNEWTFTTHSCGGHWELPPDFQYPYVAFRAFRRPEEWADITRRMHMRLIKHVTAKATLYVQQGNMLPAMHSDWTHWRVAPQIGSSARRSREHFRDGQEFRETLDHFLAVMCPLLEEAMEVRRVPCAQNIVTYSGCR